MRHQDPIGNEGVIAEDGNDVRIMAGHWRGQNGASQTLWPVGYLDVKLAPGARFTHTLTSTCGASRAGDYPRTILFRGQGEVEITADENGCGMLFMSGEPIGEPVAKMSPFVMNTHEELFQTAEDFRAGVFA